MNEEVEKRIRECREKRLKKLDLHDCGLTEIPKEVGDMAWLKALNIAGNKNLTDITLLEKLVNLEEIIACNTKISDLNPLKELRKLTTIEISESAIFDISPILPFIRKGIKVTWNKPLYESNRINVGGPKSPLINPPREIIKQGNEAIIRFFEEKERLGAKSFIKVREAKLLIVGQGGAGKTTLRDKLLNAEAELPPPDATTRGIEIRCLDEKMPGSGEPFKLNIWDFGGQNIQHYAHQFFLTGSALYALVSSEREQNENFQYWLNIIEMLGGASPVVIVQNKKAGHFEEIRNAAAIRERFGNVLNHFFAVDLKDAATEQEFRDLRKEILFRASQLPHVEREYLASFAAVREKLEAAAATGKHFLKWDEYLAVGHEIGIEDNEDLMKDYANAFTFLGVCQYFPDDLQLRNFVFLNPKWIIDALFQLLYHKKVEKQHGVFEEKDTLEIWKGAEYRGMEGHLVRMMENFELCYRITGDSHRYIVPQRLPAEKQSYNWDEPDATPLLYEYKFMPKGIVTRLTCRLHTRIEGDHVWNDAVIFSQGDGKARVFVREVYGENKIELRAAGEKREALFNEVIRQIDDIHVTSKFANLQVDKKVPCPCSECSANLGKRYFFDYDYLVQLLDDGEIEERCQLSRKKINIELVLKTAGVKYRLQRHKDNFDSDINESETATPLRIFISYSHKDFKEKERLLVHLKPLERSARAVIWEDGQIKAGANWHDDIQQNLERADVILLLFSPDFINSNYIWEKEMEIAFRLQAEQGKIVVPILMKECLYSALDEVKKQQFVPHQKGKLVAVGRWVGERGYVEVAERILALVDGK